MYLRITHVQFDPSRFDDVVPIVQEVTTAVQQLPGCQDVYQGMDRAAGTGVAVSVWDSEDHARFPRDVLGDAVTRLQNLGVQFEPPRIYELRR
jgi:quinol monooxygenase YgiN